jgi:CRISPR-associated protein Cmr1
MQHITFTLRTLTPLFLSGADQVEAELRAPSLRGLMRYWLRALVGGIVGTDPEDLKVVTEQETAVFGATNQASVISIRIRVSNASPKPCKFTEQINTRVGNKMQVTGKGYLLWSMAVKEPPRQYFPIGTSFQVMLSARGQDDVALQRAIAAFWLLTHLGAIGSRSRRCAGSLSVEAVDTTGADHLQMPDLLSFQSASSIDELQKQIRQGLQAAKKLYTPSLSQKRVDVACFDVLAPGVCHIWLLQEQQPWSSPEKAMEALGKKLQSFRSHIYPIGRRKIFGLPLRSVPGARRASPLLLRIIKLREERYIGVAVLFKTKGRGVQMSDYELINDWTAMFPVRREVTL